GSSSDSSALATALTPPHRFGSDSTNPCASSSRKDSRTGAWLVTSSCAICIATSASPGLYSPFRIRASRISLTCARKLLRLPFKQEPPLHRWNHSPEHGHPS